MSFDFLPIFLNFYVNIFHNGEDYFAGIDLFGKELNLRGHRVFAHSASFKGDLAYYFIRKSGFKRGSRLLVGFAKDGTLAIEAGLYDSQIPLLKNINLKFPAFKELKLPAERKKTEQQTSANIFAFDESAQNYTACRKNVQLAGVNVAVKKLTRLRNSFNDMNST